MDDRAAQVLGAVRLALAIYGSIGLFSMARGVIGLAGVLAYAVSQRSHEIGIRVALGASGPEILRLAMREGVGLVIAGTLLGVACSYGILRLLNHILAALAQIGSARASDPTSCGSARLSRWPRYPSWPATCPPAAPHGSILWPPCAGVMTFALSVKLPEPVNFVSSW
jgi:ABC-type antimicrobial peptide transport system permease subunit